MSDVPIRLSRPLRKTLLTLNKVAYAQIVSEIILHDLERFHFMFMVSGSVKHCTYSGWCNRSCILFYNKLVR